MLMRLRLEQNIDKEDIFMYIFLIFLEYYTTCKEEDKKLLEEILV